jgi:hypothetical protein
LDPVPLSMQINRKSSVQIVRQVCWMNFSWLFQLWNIIVILISRSSSLDTKAKLANCPAYYCKDDNPVRHVSGRGKAENVLKNAI